MPALGVVNENFRLPVVESIISKKKLTVISDETKNEEKESVEYFSNKLKEKEQIQEVKRKRKLLIEEETFMSKMKDIDT